MPQTQPPRGQLPPPRPIQQRAVVNPRKPFIGAKVASQHRGKPFSITWDDALHQATVTFDGHGSYVPPWLTFLMFQDIVGSANQLRRFNDYFRPHR